MFFPLANHQLDFKLILPLRDPVSVIALSTVDDRTYNRLVVHVDGSIYSYSLDVVVRLAMNQANQTHKMLEASKEVVTSDGNVVFCRCVELMLDGKDASRRPFGELILFLYRIALVNLGLVMYAAKKRLSSNMLFHVLEPVEVSAVLSSRGTFKTSMQYFKSYGEVRCF